MSSTWHKNAVAVSGIFASGKSTVCQILADMGAYIIDADDLARQVVAPGSFGLQEVIKSFGEDVLADDGSLDRRKLGNLIFQQPEKRELLQKITHPLIKAEAARLACECPPDKLLVYDCPLLFETGLDKVGFKSIVIVSAPLEDCIERAIKKTGLSREAVESRLASQISLEEKIPLADYVIENNGNIEDLKTATAEVYNQLIGA